MQFTCTLIRADEPTASGRVYSLECLESMVERARQRVADQQMFLFPGSDIHLARRDLRHLIGIVTDIDLVDGYIQIDVEPLSDSPVHQAMEMWPVVNGWMDRGHVMPGSTIVEFAAWGSRHMFQAARERSQNTRQGHLQTLEEEFFGRMEGSNEA